VVAKWSSVPTAATTTEGMVAMADDTNLVRFDTYSDGGSNLKAFAASFVNGTATVRAVSPQRLEVDLHETAGPYKAGRQPVELQPEPGYRPSFLEMARIIREGATPSYSSEHDLIAQEALLAACQML